MLVKCPNCDIEFSPGLGRCPRCDLWEPEPDEVDDDRIHYASTEMSKGRTVREMRDEFLAGGCDAQVADDLLHEARARVKRSNERNGLQLTAKGVALLFLALVLALFLPPLLDVLSGVACASVGLVLVVIGLVKCWIGWNLD
jgi:hypothetical protein